MAVANGVAMFKGRSGQTYAVSCYASDAAGVSLKFSVASKADANSQDYFDPPEPVALVDFCLAAATTQTITQLVRGGKPTGDYLLNSLHLASVVVRPQLAVVFFPGRGKVQAYQLA